MKPTAANIAKYVNARLDKTGSNNIAVYLPGLNKNTLATLANKFKVSKEPFGYIRFER